VPRGLAAEIEALVDDGHPAAATRLFMTAALGVGYLVLGILMAMWPVWRGMVGMARTAAYDCRLCEGLQDGAPLPRDRWRIRAPVLVAIGENADEFFKPSSVALVNLLGEGARRVVVGGAGHGSPVMNPAVLVPIIDEFLKEVQGEGEGDGEVTPTGIAATNDTKVTSENEATAETPAAAASAPEKVPARDELK
jgi:pimeloyl-ACP methyl ester carboxylesterase